MSHPDLNTRLDINGDEYSYCAEHSPDATAGIDGFSGCEVEDNPDCHPDRLACPAFVEYMKSLLAEPLTSYFQMIFPARLKDGEIESEASPEHPDPTGLVDRRTYIQKFENDVPGDIEPMFDNQNPDGTYRFECTRCISRDCNRCSWNKHCVCVPPCVLYTPEERAAIDSDDDNFWGDENGEWDGSEELM